MKKTKLVCNLNMGDFFTIPDDSNVWRRKNTEKIWVNDDGKRYQGYECISIYDNNLWIVLKGSERVDLVDF